MFDVAYTQQAARRDGIEFTLDFDYSSPYAFLALTESRMDILFNR